MSHTDAQGLGEAEEEDLLRVVDSDRENPGMVGIDIDIDIDRKAAARTRNSTNTLLLRRKANELEGNESDKSSGKWEHLGVFKDKTNNVFVSAA